MTDLSQRNAYWLTLGTLATTLYEIARYHGDVASARFIARGHMFVVGVAVLLGAVTVAGTLAAAVRRTPGAIRPAATYRGQAFVNASAAAFILGMLAYLAFYPPTPWVFDTMLALALPFGIMLMLPVREPDAPAVVSVLNGCAGLTACAAGFAVGSGVLVMVGLVVGVVGWGLAVTLQRAMTRSPFSTLFSAFDEDS